MQKKTYLIRGLDCANCAAKIETMFNAHEQVESATITYATGQLRLTAQDPDALIGELQALARRVEPEATIYPRDAAPAQEKTAGHHSHHHDHGDHDGHEHGDCGCGHGERDEHDHGNGCGHGDHDGHDHGGCGCGCEGCGHQAHHDHKEHEDGGHHHDSGEGGQEGRSLAIGAGLFVLGLILRPFIPGWAETLLFLVTYVLLGAGVVADAGKNLVKGRMLDENFLMALASIGAFFIGNAPEGVGVMLFYRVGEWFEHKAVERSRSQIMEAVDLRPEVVRLAQGDEVREIPAGEAKAGDLVLVRPGDRVPLDGVVVSGESRIDTAPITGEPVPVRAGAGDTVTSGCVNLTGQLTVRVEKPLSESMVTRILDSVENAAANKPKAERFITRFARIYTPVVVGIAAVVALVPSIVTGDWNYWVYTALSFLVMSCPCALVLSVPLAFFAGIGVGSKRGILFKGGQSMEAMGQVKAVVMDKTGTITRGDFRVQKIQGGDAVLELCACCEQDSTHPIAESVVAEAQKRGMILRRPESKEELAGRGIRAKLDGRTVLCGNGRLLEENGVDYPREEAYGTRVLVAEEGVYLGALVIADTVKPGAEQAVRRLQERGIHTVMLTGDAVDSAQAVAGMVGIQEVHAGLLPQQKLERLQAIRQERGAVMFVGDGINDAPVLAGADVGAAMGSGADAAIEAADVVFMTSDVEAVPQSLAIAADTRKIAWQNVVFALAVKLAVMLLGLFGYASMWLAVFADSGVAMLCVLNSIRMLYHKK